MKRLLLPAALLLLGGCSSEIDELEQFVRDSDKGLPRKVDPLPAVKPFEPFTYEGFDLPDPFKPRKLSAPKEGAGGGLAPDLNRRKEPLDELSISGVDPLRGDCNGDVAGAGRGPGSVPGEGEGCGSEAVYAA